MPQILIPILSIFALIFAFKKLRKNTRETLAGKKVMLFGPPMSGKTTFLNWLVKDELMEEYIATGSGEFKEVLDKDKETTYTLCDMGGGPGFLTGGVMEKRYMENDIILMFFNYAKYISDNEYKADVEARFDALYGFYKKVSKQVLLIGSHSDQLESCQKKNSGIMPLVDSSKEYYQFLGGLKLILANLTDKKEVMGIWEIIREEL